MSKMETLRVGLAKVGTSGTPALRSFATWVLDNLPLVAFSSIRGLANHSEVNPNTVTRLANELGYVGFNAFRADVQSILQDAVPTYGDRARALRNRTGRDVYCDVIGASRENAESMFSAQTLEMLESCIEPLLGARRIYSVGVRSCYSVAHYFSYVGGMAFPNFVEVPSMPGGIVDQLTQTTPEDIVVGITYAHYSAEVVRACQIAQACGARVLALTDSYSSPIAVDAWKVLRLPMAGPQFMPTLASAFLAIEMLLVGMAARSETAADNLSAFEKRIGKYGGYSQS
jgi:DNA-binding MurR/RpiR family transcriptional regulator